MMKYLIGIGVLVVVAIGFFVLAPSTPPAPAPTATAPADAPQAVTTDEDGMLEQMAAATREALPATVSDTLTQTDAVFLPRMRIMEHSYVTTSANPRATAPDLRTMIETRASDLCVSGREMFAMGVTLRNSFEDREGNLIQRVYLLPEDCRRFY